MLTEVQIPGFLGLAEITIPTTVFTTSAVLPGAPQIQVPQGIFDIIQSIGATISSVDAYFTALLEAGVIAMDDIRMLMENFGNVVDFQNAKVEADVNVTNTTSVTVAQTATVSAVSGAGTIAIAATDSTLVRDTLQTEIDAFLPKLQTALSCSRPSIPTRWSTARPR